FTIANGAYSITDTPSVDAINTPHVFQGTNTDVNVPPSSNALDKFLGCKPLSLKALAYILEGTMIDMYCSEHVKLVPIQETMTDAINEPVVLATFKITEINADNMPEYSSTPPKVIATKVNEIV